MSPQWVIRSTLCNDSRGEFSGLADRVVLFPVDQIQDGGHEIEIEARLISERRVAYLWYEEEENTRAALN